MQKQTEELRHLKLKKNHAGKDRFIQADLFFYTHLKGQTIIEIKGSEDYKQLFISFVHKVLIYFKLDNLVVRQKSYILVSWF